MSETFAIHRGIVTAVKPPLEWFITLPFMIWAFGTVTIRPSRSLITVFMRVMSLTLPNPLRGRGPTSTQSSSCMGRTIEIRMPAMAFWIICWEAKATAMPAIPSDRRMADRSSLRTEPKPTVSAVIITTYWKERATPLDSRFPTGSSSHLLMRVLPTRATMTATMTSRRNDKMANGVMPLMMGVSSQLIPCPLVHVCS